MENPFEYRREMDNLAFTPEQKARMTARLLRAAEKQPRAARRPVRRVAVFAVTAAAVLVAGCGAMAAGLVGHSFDSVFGTAQTKVINKIGRPVGASATDNGITVTADAIIGDKYNACVVYSVKRKDGSPLTLPSGVPVKNLYFEKSICDLQGGSGSHGAAWFTENKSAGADVQYVNSFSFDKPLNKGKISVEFGNLQYYDEKTKKMVTLYGGDWKFGFSVNYEDSSASLPAGETFTNDGIRFRITNLSVSPVGMHVEYEADHAADSPAGVSDSRTDGQDGGSVSSAENGREPEQVRHELDRYLNGVSIILTKTDGSTLDMTDSGGSIQRANGKMLSVKSGVFQEIVPLKEMKSISIGGVEIPIPSK